MAVKPHEWITWQVLVQGKTMRLYNRNINTKEACLLSGEPISQDFTIS